MVDFNDDQKLDRCLISKYDDSILWYKRLTHVNIRTIEKLAKKNLVSGLPKLTFDKIICKTCELGKLKKSYFHSKVVVSTSKPLELLHLDLFGPTKHSSLNGSIYDFVIVDDYSHFT